jgi:hypothetical protein
LQAGLLVPEASFFYSADTPAMAGPVSAFFFMYYMQELYSISSFDLAENAKNSRIPLPISFVSPFQGLDARCRF